jgi:hypothetical protein
MTVTGTPTGTIAAGAYVTNAASTVTGFTQVQAYGTGGTTGTGGAGTYSVTVSQTRASGTYTTAPASFTADVSTLGVMTVSAVADGTISPGMYVYASGGTLNQFNVQPYGTGGTTGVGGTGTYKLSASPFTAVSSQGFIGNGQIRVTLNSTTGLTTGDTLYLTGMLGTGVLPQRVNGLQWVKVINGTQIDLFQRDFNGGYTSGGTGGGDRTSLFPIGAKALMTGWNNQSYWAEPYSYPSNPQWFEYKTVVSNNSGTHQVCFDTQLTATYKSTWPQMNTGSNFEVDPGGPATLYVYPSTWEMTAVFKDLTIDNSGQSYMQGRNMTLNNVVMTGGSCVSPTQNETVNWINVTGTGCDIETDKIVRNWNVTNLSVFKVVVQSSSFTNIVANGVTTSSGWYGSGRNTSLQNMTVADLKIGTSSYGASEESSCVNCATTAGLTRGTPITRVDYPGFEWSMSGGVITIPNAYSYDASRGVTNPGGEIQTRGLVPGSYNFWSGAGGGGSFPQTGRAFKVVDVTQDLDNTYVQTSEAGGFPTGTWTTNGLSVFPHPAPKLTTTSMSGALTATAFNGCTAQSPMYSCANFVHTGGAAGTSTFSVPLVWGELSTFTFTNNVPYTNTGALGWTISQFGQMAYLKTDNTQGLFGVATGSGGMINTKLPSGGGGGTRTLTQSGVTGNQTGDAGLTAPPTGAVFGGGTSAVFTANTPSDSPQITVTLRTDQHLP